MLFTVVKQTISISFLFISSILIKLYTNIISLIRPWLGHTFVWVSEYWFEVTERQICRLIKFPNLTTRTAKFVKWSHWHLAGSSETNEQPSLDHVSISKSQKTHSNVVNSFWNNNLHEKVEQQQLRNSYKSRSGRYRNIWNTGHISSSM